MDVCTMSMKTLVLLPIAGPTCNCGTTTMSTSRQSKHKAKAVVTPRAEPIIADGNRPAVDTRSETPIRSDTKRGPMILTLGDISFDWHWFDLGREAANAH